MADLADFYPASQQVPQTMNGSQPAPVAGRGAAATSGAAGLGGHPALWVLIIVAAGILLLHAE